MRLVEPGRAGAMRLAVARMAFGVAGFVAPKRFGRLWIGDDGASPRVAVITRAFAIRDFALGLGVFVALKKGAPVRGWIEAGMLSDAGDVVSALASPVACGQKALVASTAAAAVGIGFLALRDLD